MKLEDIARESRATHKGDKSGVPIVGLEHLIPQEIKFTGYDVDTENTFTKAFKKGQILFGRRRAYLKKAAIADFDGICSGDITVIEAIPGKVDPLLLPFIIQNDKFFDYAVSRSAGGLSPRVKWEHLKDYEFDLPSIDEQRILADKLWAAYRLKESYKKLLTATQEMVKSQFIEMFGDPMTNSKGWVEYGKINQYAQIVLGSTPNSKEASYWDGDIKWITPAEMTEESYYIYDTDRHITEDGVKSASLTLLPYRSVLFSTRAPIGKVGLVGSPMYCNQGFKNFICGDKLNPVYLYYTLIYKREYLVSLGTGTTFKELSKRTVEGLDIAIPPLSLQEQFENIYHQADKSEFVGFKSQFIEMFSSVPKVDINCMVDTIWGSSPDSKTYYDNGEGVPFYQGKTEFGDIYINEASTFCTAPIRMAKQHAILMSVRAPVGAVNIATQDCCIGRGLASITPKVGKSITMFVFYALKYMEDEIERLGTGSTFKAINKDSYAKIQMPDVDIEKQIEFVKIAEQADKSEYYN